MNYPLLSQKMPVAIKRVWRKTWLCKMVVALFIGLLSLGSYQFFWHHQWLFYGALIYLGLTVIILLIDFLLIPYRYTFHRYELAKEDLAFQQGFIFRSTTYVPLQRIQHIETEQGPFLRQENLMGLVIHTAATKHRILGLEVQTAQQLRQQIIEMIRQVADDV